MEIFKEYANGTGHIDQRDGRFLVSFYGSHVQQVWCDSLQSSRFALRRIAAE